jgi:hypothetical protein
MHGRVKRRNQREVNNMYKPPMIEDIAPAMKGDYCYGGG